MSSADVHFNPFDWYWGPFADGRVFSSKRIAMVPASDPDYVAFLAGGGLRTPCPKGPDGNDSLDELQAQVLDHYGLHATLEHYAGAVRYALETAGIEVGGAAIPTDRGSQAMIAGAFNLIQAKPDATIRFKTGSGAFETLDASAIQIIAIEVGQHVQAAFARESDVAVAIAAGTVTTPAEVDAAFAAT